MGLYDYQLLCLLDIFLLVSEVEYLVLKLYLDMMMLWWHMLVGGELFSGTRRVC